MWLRLPLAAVLTACGSSGHHEPAVSSTGSAPTELTEPEAQALATRLAEAAFEEQDFYDAAGNPIDSATFPPDEWVISREGGAWSLRYDQDDSEHGTVNFLADGSQPVVDVGWSDD